MSKRYRNRIRMENEFKKKSKIKPFGIRVLAILYLITLIMIPINLFSSGGKVFNYGRNLFIGSGNLTYHITSFLAGIFKGVGIPSVLIAGLLLIIVLIVGIGLWKYKRWSLFASAILSVLGLIFAGNELIIFFSGKLQILGGSPSLKIASYIFGFIISLAILIYSIYGFFKLRKNPSSVNNSINENSGTEQVTQDTVKKG